MNKPTKEEMLKLIDKKTEDLVERFDAEELKTWKAIRTLIENQPRVTRESMKAIIKTIIDAQKETEQGAINYELLYLARWFKSIGVVVEEATDERKA